MAKNKRRRDDDGPRHRDAGSQIPPKKRQKRTEDDNQLAKIYVDLADEVQAVRIKAAGDLLNHVTSKPQEGQISLLESVERRLIRGLCSGRKAARLGFSIAFTELLRFKLNDRNISPKGPLLVPVLDKIEKFTETEGNVSGQEKRDHLLGRRYAYQAILHSDICLRQTLAPLQWASLTQSIFRLAAQKQWLRREVIGMLHDYLTSTSGQKLDTTRVTEMMETASSLGLLKTPEGVGLWLTVQKSFPEAALPAGVWHKNDPLATKERQTLSKVLLESATQDDAPLKNSGARQAAPSFAWPVILSRLTGKDHYSQDDGTQFAKFWEICVVSTMFSSSSSPERKAVGLQILSLAIATVTDEALSMTLHPTILRGILDQRANPDRYLYEAAKAPLNALTARIKQSPSVTAAILSELLQKGAVNFDQQSKTKTVETIVSQASEDGCSGIGSLLRTLILETSKKSTSPHQESQLRSLTDLLLLLVRSHKSTSIAPAADAVSTAERQGGSWLEKVLRDLTILAYIDARHGAMFRSRLMSCLNALMGDSLDRAVRAPVSVVYYLKNDPNNASGHLSNPARSVLESAYTCLQDVLTKPDFEEDNEDGASLQAYALLFALLILQVYSEEDDAVVALEDLVTSYESRDETRDAITMVVELLLSFVAKPSALFRKLAEQVFSVFASQLTSESLDSLTHILGQREDMSGQQELFDAHDDASNAEDDEDYPEDTDIVDVEDASNVELANGEQVAASSSESDSETDEDSSSSAEGGAAADEEDEEAAFDKKLAAALGTGQVASDDSDEDGSDMDDEQMMALEPHLASIFKERHSKPNKKQEKRNAKENIINFKNRVLDLLSIYVKSQFASTLAMEVIMPLTRLVRETTNKQTAEKAVAVLQRYFDACSKKKTLPQLEDEDSGFGMLRDVHEEMRQGGSKLHASACSRSSLFLTKILVSIDKKEFGQVSRMYSDLMTEWFQGNNKVHQSVFKDWMSWVLSKKADLKV